MSRVFEALTKAEEENKIEPEDVTGLRETVPDGSAAAFKNGNVHGWPIAGNGKGATAALALKPGVNGTNGARGAKSWRERIEELFYGWDLRRIANYPIVALEKDSAAAEQYKILREQIKRLRIESGIQVFSISSPIKRDGKTTVAVNLAAALALDYEQKVLLIDGDLRAPGVHGYFNLNSSPGLGDYLSSSHYLEVTELVRETFLPGLWVLPAGTPSSLSSELLAKEKMSQLMTQVRAEFPEHQIIVDCPPILSTPDPLVLARQVDGILLVVRAGRTPRDYLVKALQAINSTKVMGVVLNGVELGMASKYYYYSTADAH